MLIQDTHMEECLHPPLFFFFKLYVLHLHCFDIFILNFCFDAFSLAVGFGFLTFDNEDSVEQACAEHYVDVNGKQVTFFTCLRFASSHMGLVQREKYI